MQNPTIVLGSSSPARRELLKRLKIKFKVAIPDVDETPHPNETAQALVARLAKEKALSVGKKFPNALIIGCDQVGLVDDVILGKPLSYEKAVEQLRFKSGKKVRFYTAIVLLDTRTQHMQASTEIFDVYIRKLTDEMIKNYLSKENPLQCAGSLDIEGLGIVLVDKLAGDDYTSLIGLPLIRLARMLEEAGFSY